MIEIEYKEPIAADRNSIEEALHAYGIVQLLKEEIVLMENEAQRLYGLADECLEEKRYFKSNYYRQQGNVLLERVCALKQIMNSEV